MHHRWRGFTIVMALGLVLAACGGAGSPSAEPSTGGESAAPSESMAAFEPTVYPADGPAECGADNNPTNLSQIKAVDQYTVEFTLCNPDVAFLSKIAFSALAINDSDWLQAHVPDGSIISMMNGTGPYEMDTWNRGSELDYVRNDNYWGDAAKTQTLVFRWSAESAQRLVELQAGTIDGMDNPGVAEFDSIQNDSSLTLYEREGTNVFYIGFNNTFAPFDNEQVRQAIAMGIDRQRIVDRFYPPGSEVATHFTPCSFPFACEGDDWYDFDPTAAKQMLADAGFPDGFDTTIHLRDVVRSYLPEPTVVAQDIQAQLKDNLGINATIDVQESGTFIANANAGELDGIHLLGWGADYPDVTNFLDFHFGSGASPQFGDHFDDVTSALADGASTAVDAERQAAYETANNAIREHVPMIPVVHAGSGTAFKADVDGAHASPLGNENFSVMDPGGRDAFVWMQNAEPIGLYCADETDGESLRACEQTMESLYAYEIGGTTPIPSLATECAPNDDLTVWTCSLREGVQFHDGSALDANDVVLSYAVQWDANHELHKGNTGDFTYFSAFFGGFLNPPPAS
jgi:peptide/nickel transport system substrate-binding protein